MRAIAWLLTVAVIGLSGSAVGNEPFCANCNRGPGVCPAMLQGLDADPCRTDWLLRAVGRLRLPTSLLRQRLGRLLRASLRPRELLPEALPAGADSFQRLRLPCFKRSPATDSGCADARTSAIPSAAAHQTRPERRRRPALVTGQNALAPSPSGRGYPRNRARLKAWPGRTLPGARSNQQFSG